jgi:predicted ATPase
MALIAALEGEQQARAGIATIRETLATRRSNDVESTGFVLCLFASACGLAGEIDAGLHAAEQAIADATATGARLWESELHRIAGNLLLGSSGADRARSESHYLRAIEVAREQQARSLELRASASLARLWAERGERQKAYDLLAPIYATFTEGFGTPDLIEAKVLLDELN